MTAGNQFLQQILPYPNRHHRLWFYAPRAGCNPILPVRLNARKKFETASAKKAAQTWSWAVSAELRYAE